MKKIKQLITICATLALFSCAPQPVAAQSPSEFCYNLSQIGHSIALSRDRGDSIDHSLGVVSKQQCSENMCRIIKDINREIIFTAYSSNLSGRDLEMLYNVKCLTRIR